MALKLKPGGGGSSLSPMAQSSCSLSIGFVIGSMSRNAGGLFEAVRCLVLKLHNLGIDATVYAVRDRFSDLDTGEWLPLVPELMEPRIVGPMVYAPQFTNKLSQSGCELLHQHGIWQLQSRSVSRWKRENNGRVVISPHGMLDPWALANSSWKKRLVGAWFENRNLSEADCLHALNASEAASIRAYGLTNPIAVIPNAIGLPEIAPRTGHNERKTLLFLGRIHPKKGLTELVAAWAMAAGQRPDLTKKWRLVIAGWDDGGHLGQLEKQIAGLNLCDSVAIIGPAFGTEKDQLFRQCDAFILPSFSEGLPMTVLEAWAYRLPVLITEYCNLPEGFAAGAAVEISTDPDLMAQSLLSTLLDSDLAPMGEVGRALVEEQFSWDHVAAQHLAVYRWLCRGDECPDCVAAGEG